MAIAAAPVNTATKLKALATALALNIRNVSKKPSFTFQPESKTIRTCRGGFFKELQTPAFNLRRWGTIFLWPERMLFGGSAKSLSEMTNTLTRVTFVHPSAERRTPEEKLVVVSWNDGLVGGGGWKEREKECEKERPPFLPHHLRSLSTCLVLLKRIRLIFGCRRASYGPLLTHLETKDAVRCNLTTCWRPAVRKMLWIKIANNTTWKAYFRESRLEVLFYRIQPT